MNWLPSSGINNLKSDSLITIPNEHNEASNFSSWVNKGLGIYSFGFYFDSNDESLELAEETVVLVKEILSF